MHRMRRKDIALTVFLLAPIAIVAVLVWLIVATLHDQRDDPRFRAPPQLGGKREPAP